MSIDVGVAATVGRTDHAHRWERLLPLSGAAFFVLGIVGAIVAGQTPADDASGAAVLSAFSDHAGAEQVSSLLGALAVVSLIVFAAELRTRLEAAGAKALGSAVFGGAVVLAVGGAARAGIGWALASGHDHLDPAAAQALYTLFTTHYPAIAGIAAYMLAAGAAILRTGVLPSWLGWVALPVGLAALAPPTLLPLIAAGLWSLVTGALMYVRTESASTPKG